MQRLGMLLVLFAPVMAAGACAADGRKSQEQAHAQRMAGLAATASAGAVAAAPGGGGPAESQPAPSPTGVAKGVTATNAAAGTFEQLARPVLRRNCAPCHEPGGQMYGKLPFDKADVVSSHPEGVLKRLKGDDRRAVADWLANNPPAPAL